MPDSKNDAKPDLGDRSLLERSLGVITEVRAGEGVTALLLTLNVFLLLTAYYVIKPVREGLILTMPGGAEKKSYLSAAIAITLLFAVPLYGQVANRVAKNKLVIGVTLFFASHLALFWILSRTPLEKELGLVFFVWVGIFNMMVVAQFWAFANDIYSSEQGKRLFAIVGLGASLGGALGAYITSFLTDVIKLGTYELLLFAGLLLVACAGLTQMAHRRGRGEKNVGAGNEEEKPKKSDGGFVLVFKTPYLLYIALFSLVFTWVNTNGEYMLGVLVKERAGEMAAAAGAVGEEAVRAFSKTYATSFYASFFLFVNIIGVAIQMFAVSRIVKFGGLRLAFFILPAIALLDAAALIVLPAALSVAQLTVLRPGKIAENAADYSVNNTVRNMLWLPTTTEMKYKAKQAVDTFFVRMGDVASAGLVFVGGAMFHWPVRSFAIIDVVLVAVWLVLAHRIVVRNRALTEQAENGEREGRKPNP